MVEYLRTFRNDETGSASVESLFWIPIFVYFLVLVLDVSSIFFGKAQILQDVQDANRALSIGVLTTEAETEEFIKTAIASFSTNATIDAVINTNTGIVTTDVSVPASDLMALGSIPVFASTIINVSVQQVLEH